MLKDLIHPLTWACPPALSGMARTPFTSGGLSLQLRRRLLKHLHTATNASTFQSCLAPFSKGVVNIRYH